MNGKNLAPENRGAIEDEVRRIFTEKSKEEQIQIVKDVINFLDNQDREVRWLAGCILEEILEYDSSLVPMDTIIKISRDKDSLVRSSASVCLFTLANIAPSQVPLDVVMRLASPLEDWYVFTPAVATLKTLAHKMPRALDAVIHLAENEQSASIGIAALCDVVRNDPEVLSEERLSQLEKSSSKDVLETLVEIKTLLKRREYGPNIIRYSPF